MFVSKICLAFCAVIALSFAQGEKPVPSKDTAAARDINADVNRDGVVDCRDLQEVLDVTLGKISCPADHRCDVNRDGKVNVVDLQLVINALPDKHCKISEK